MIVTLIKCDVCGTLKGDTSHWFQLFCSHTKFVVMTMDRDLQGKWEHICSRQCLHTRLDRWAEETTTTPTEGANSHGSTSQS